MARLKLLLEIVITFAKIDLLSFGGGYVAIPIVEKQIVEVNKWMSAAEFMDVIAIDELTPGPIAINCATFVGMKMAGVLGAIAATLGNILPSFIICLILIRIYAKYKNLDSLKGILGGLKSMVVALITGVTLTIIKNAIYIEGSLSLLYIILASISLFMFRKFKKIEPILIILGSGLLGLIISLIR